MSAAPIRVLVADDHALVREGIRHVLTGAQGFEVVGEAGTGSEVVTLAAACLPDVILLDISMPGGSGLEVAGELRRVAPGAKVLMLSMHDHAEYVLDSVRAGAHGYLRKDTAPAELRNAIRAVHRGEAFFSPAVALRLTAAVRGEETRDERPPGKLDLLTNRERDVLLGIARGETNKEIAARLGISPRTVETHRESLMRKLEIRTVAGLTRFVVEQGLLADGETAP
ncbi:MAG TPA: response regulator transcription factor [Gemmatimonadales bacterium]|nr:response regulator transcription factor [Gemmatimonadales bacterium]